MNRIELLLHLIRFSHTLFALPFAVLGAAMAWNLNVHAQSPVLLRWQDAAGILLCMVFARSAAMAFNRLADRKFDALNPRTENRHLVVGSLSVASVACFTVVCSFGFILSTLLFLPNKWPIACCVPVLLWLLGYSFAKRFTSLAHYWLASGLALSPICAWIVLRPPAAVSFDAFPVAPVLLGLAVFFWVGGFDIIYSCQDYETDKRLGLHSIPTRFGIANSLRIAAASHFLMLVTLAILPVFYPAFGGLYYLGLTLLAVLLIFEHLVVRPDDLSRVNFAFFNLNATISIGLLCLGLSEICLHL